MPLGITQAEKLKILRGRLVFSTGQASLLLGVAPRTICTWTNKGYLKGSRIPTTRKDRRYSKEELYRFAKEYGVTELPDDIPTILNLSKKVINCPEDKELRVVSVGYGKCDPSIEYGRATAEPQAVPAILFDMGEFPVSLATAIQRDMDYRSIIKPQLIVILPEDGGGEYGVSYWYNTGAFRTVHSDVSEADLSKIIFDAVNSHHKTDPIKNGRLS